MNCFLLSVLGSAPEAVVSCIFSLARVTSSESTNIALLGLLNLNLLTYISAWLDRVLMALPKLSVLIRRAHLMNALQVPGALVRRYIDVSRRAPLMLKLLLKQTFG